MKFLVDENLPVEAAGLLRNAGHDAVTAVERGVGGAGDARIAELLKAEGRALVTLDVDFANTQAYPPQAYAGLIVLRLEHQGKVEVMRVIASFLPQLSTEPLVGRLWIVEDDRIRVR